MQTFFFMWRDIMLLEKISKTSILNFYENDVNIYEQF